MCLLWVLPSLNVLVTISNGMWAVKLCSSKILQFPSEGGDTNITNNHKNDTVVAVVIVPKRTFG